MKEIIKEWVTELIERDPCLYGGDNGAVEVLSAYITANATECGDSCIDNLKAAVAMLTSVDRIRRMVLEERPELDRRTAKSHGGTPYRQSVIYDFLNSRELIGSNLVTEDCIGSVKRAAEAIMPPAGKDNEVYHDGGGK